MTRTSFLPICMLACLVLAGFAHAGSGTVNSQANQQTGAAAKTGEAAAVPMAGVSPPVSAEVRSATEEELQVIRQKGAAVKAKASAAADAKLNAASLDVEKEATTKEVDVSTRLASEFGVTKESLVAEKQSLSVSWGEVLIAHTLQANSVVPVTVPQVVALRVEGLGWAQIAAGLGFGLPSAVAAVQSEVKVALGSTPADGKVAVIRGSKLDVSANTKPGTKSAKAPVSASVGAGLTPPVPAAKP